MCGEPGHRSSNCPKRVAVNLVVAEKGKVDGEQEVKSFVMMLIHMPMILIKFRKMKKACH